MPMAASANAAKLFMGNAGPEFIPPKGAGAHGLEGAGELFVPDDVVIRLSGDGSADIETE